MCGFGYRIVKKEEISFISKSCRTIEHVGERMQRKEQLIEVKTFTMTNKEHNEEKGLMAEHCEQKNNPKPLAISKKTVQPKNLDDLFIYKHEPVLLDVPLISQYPELPTGCEVTALAMALQYYGVEVSKTTLADEMPYDRTLLVRDQEGVIVSWGDPEVGYVGNPYELGVTINPKPLKTLLNKYRSGGIAFYGKDFKDIVPYVRKGNPVIVWITLNYELLEERTWITPKGKVIHSPRPLHVVVVTGFDHEFVYVNDSDSNEKNAKIPISQFIKIYDAMGRRALVVE